MSAYAIRVESLSKRYRLSEASEHHDTLRDTIMAAVRRNGAARDTQDFWALRDVSFDVRAGEIVGVIGRNGAGKSTLLKLLSRITQPTAGSAEIHGRVGTLLEVGTGFHPELSGRENILLSGAIMGMKRREIAARMDEIIAFAELERFIETPVKRYSVGMYLRLAFSVSAHLETEILLVDEVLAVGDVAFQQKCLSKISSVAGEGRTVLFVSHNLPAIKRLCQRALVLLDGSLKFDGAVESATQFYLNGGVPDATLATHIFVGAPATRREPYAVQSVEMRDELDQPKYHLHTGDYVRFVVTWRTAERTEKGAVEFGVHSLDGVPLIGYSTRPVSTVDVPFAVGANCIALDFERFPLAAGQYYLAVSLTRPPIEVMYRNDNFALLNVEAGDVFNSGFPLSAARSLVVVPHRWRTLSNGTGHKGG